MTWVRHRTFTRLGVVMADITNGKDWISIKGETSKQSRKLTKHVLALLNAHEVLHQQNDNGFALCGVDLVTVAEEPMAVTCSACREVGV